MQIFASSVGWNETDPTCTDRNASFVWAPIPGRRGSSSSVIPATAIRYR